MKSALTDKEGNPTLWDQVKVLNDIFLAWTKQRCLLDLLATFWNIALLIEFLF